MGLLNELNAINTSIKTDKQQRIEDRQERKQLQELQRQEKAQIQTLQLYIANIIQSYIDIDYALYSVQLYNKSLINQIKNGFLKSHQNYGDIILLYFDDLYYKTLKKELLKEKMNQNAQPQQQQPQQLARNDKIFIITSIFRAFMQVCFNVAFLIIGVFAIFLHPVNQPKRRL